MGYLWLLAFMVSFVLTLFLQTLSLAWFVLPLKLKWIAKRKTKLLAKMSLAEKENHGQIPKELKFLLENIETEEKGVLRSIKEHNELIRFLRLSRLLEIKI